MSGLIPPFSGHCPCGAVTYTCDTAPLWQSLCHCESCRRATSSPVTGFFGMADGHWRWTGKEPAPYNSSPGVWRSFCPSCGSQMSYRSDDIPGEMHFYAASLDDSSGFAPEKHDFWEEKVPWLHLSDSLPRA